MRILDFFKTKKEFDVTQVQLVKPYYMKYDGRKGYAMVATEVTKKFVAIEVNAAGGGKIWRVMKISDKKLFSDFGGTCTSMDIAAIAQIINVNNLDK